MRQFGLRLVTALVLAAVLVPTASALPPPSVPPVTGWATEIVGDAADGVRTTVSTVDRMIDSEIQSVRDNLERIRAFQDDVDRAVETVNDTLDDLLP